MSVLQFAICRYAWSNKATTKYCSCSIIISGKKRKLEPWGLLQVPLFHFLQWKPDPLLIYICMLFYPVFLCLLSYVSNIYMLCLIHVVLSLSINFIYLWWSFILPFCLSSSHLIRFLALIFALYRNHYLDLFNIYVMNAYSSCYILIKWGDSISRVYPTLFSRRVHFYFILIFVPPWNAVEVSSNQIFYLLCR